MGNQQVNGQTRRYQQSPFVCCGDNIPRENLQQQSPNLINLRRYEQQQQKVTRNTYQQTGSTSFKDKDITIYRRPQNTLQNSTFNNTFGSRDGNLFKPITQQQQIKKSTFATFKKPSYGAFNSHNAQNFNSYGLHTKQSRDKQIDVKNYKPTPMADFVGEKDIKAEMRNSRTKQLQKSRIGQGKYSGKRQQFDNNKRIVDFLTNNYVKQASFKFYDTKDDSFLLNNSTIMYAKKKQDIISEQQSSTNNLKVNKNLSRLQQPIQLTLQIDARIILGSCLFALAIVVIILGGTVFYTETNFFVCMMVGIMLYVGYLILSFVYNDIFAYLFNVKSFDQFEKDYKKVRQTQGEFAYHLNFDTPKKTIKQCYVLSKDNKYTKIQYVENQNKQIALQYIKNKHTTFLMIRYKTKTSFSDSQSQLNTINYFNDFVQQHKRYLNSQYIDKNQKNYQVKQVQKPRRQIQTRSKIFNQKQQQMKNQRFKNKINKTDFNYQLHPISQLTNKPESAITVCYMEDESDNTWYIMMFIIFTLIGLCLPFVCIFQAYTRRYRINILNRFKIA